MPNNATSLLKDRSFACLRSLFTVDQFDIKYLNEVNCYIKIFVLAINGVIGWHASSVIKRWNPLLNALFSQYTA